MVTRLVIGGDPHIAHGHVMTATLSPRGSLRVAIDTQPVWRGIPLPSPITLAPLTSLLPLDMDTVSGRCVLPAVRPGVPACVGVTHSRAAPACTRVWD